MNRQKSIVTWGRKVWLLGMVWIGGMCQVEGMNKLFNFLKVVEALNKGEFDALLDQYTDDYGQTYFQTSSERNKYSDNQLDEYANFLGYHKNVVHPQLADTLMKTQALSRLSEDTLRNCFKNLGDHKDNPEGMLADNYKTDFKTKRIKIGDWGNFQTTVQKLTECIAVIKKSSYLSTGGVGVNGLIERNTRTIRFAVTVFLNKSLTIKELKDAYVVLDRIDELVAKKTDLGLQKAENDEKDKKLTQQKKLDNKLQTNLLKQQNKGIKLQTDAQLKINDSNNAFQAAQNQLNRLQNDKNEQLNREKDLLGKKIDNDAEDKRVEKKIEAANERLKKVLNFVGSKEFFFGAIGISGGCIIIYFAAKYGLKLLFVKKPPIIESTNLPESRWSRIFGGTPEMKPVKGQPIYNPDVQKRYDELRELILQVVQFKSRARGDQGDKAVFTNVAFRGPPGTGKTYGAMCLIWNDGRPLNYVIIPTANLAMAADQADATRTLQEIFDWANEFIEATGEPVVFFWDEFDSLARPRNASQGGGVQAMSERNLQLLNKFLALVQKPNDPNIMHIFNTNLELDFAMDRRIGMEFEVDKPKGQTLFKQIKSFVEREADNWDLTIDSRLNKPDELKDIIELMEQEGFTGSDIEQFVGILGTSLGMDNASRISYERFKDAVETKVASKRKALEASRRRARGGMAVPATGKV